MNVYRSYEKPDKLRKERSFQKSQSSSFNNYQANEAAHNIKKKSSPKIERMSTTNSKAKKILNNPVFVQDDLLFNVNDNYKCLILKNTKLRAKLNAYEKEIARLVIAY